MVTNEEKDKVRELYEGWLVSNSVAITRRNNPSVYSETIYNHPGGGGISSIQLNDRSHKIIITTRINFGPHGQQSIGSVESTAQRSCVNGIAAALLQVGAQHTNH